MTSHDPLIIAGEEFHSRLLVGTGKYPDNDTMVAAHEATGAEIITVAMGRVDFNDSNHFYKALDFSRYTLLPNTAGAYTVEDAVRIARLAREAANTNWIKLEVLGDPETLLPDTGGTLEAAKILIDEGFTVLPYTNDDPIVAKKLEDLGCATVMPLASYIGSGQGFLDFSGIEIIIERANVPVVVDAGLGVPSDASQAMEIGADAVLVNTAIATAGNPVMMAEGFRLGVQGGRLAYLSGRMNKKFFGSVSSVGAGLK
ncbi:MAG TPA: thiazole synthase [bacterium]|jgi:thiazole synthase